MELISDLRNHRISYQVIVTFDLEFAKSSDYENLREELRSELSLEPSIYASADDGGKEQALPYNTLAALWRKDANESATKSHFEQKIKGIMKRHKLKGRYLVLVAQNWSACVNSL